MKNRNLFVAFLLLIFQLIPLWFWTNCKSFIDSFHFSYYDLTLQLTDLTHKDSSLPIFVTRSLHNKIVQGVLDLYKRYTQFFDIRLFITLFTFVGLFGLFFAIWYFLNSPKKDKRVGFLFLLALMLPLIEVLINPILPFVIKILIIAAPFEILSLYGHYQFLKRKNLKFLIPVYLVLILLSLLWILLLPDILYNYCVKV
jgi:hypothetical protein